MPPAHTNHTHTGHSQHNQARNQSTNKSTLAHYRVLKQHTHNHKPPGAKPSSCKKRLCRHYTHHNHKVKTLQTVKHIFLCRPTIVFLTAISPATLFQSLSGGALSVSLTHIKLHTPTHQHKSPAQHAYSRVVMPRLHVAMQ